MKIKKEFIIIISVIVILIASLIILNIMTKKTDVPEKETVTETASVQILNIQNSERAFSVTGNSGNFTVVFASDMWFSPENPNVFLNQNHVENLFNTLCTLYAVPVEENAADMVKYGLDNPATVFKIKGTDGKVYTVEIGAKSPTNSGYYIAVNGEKNVFIISNETHSLLSDNINSLRNKKIIDVNIEDVYSVTIKNEKNTITVRPKEENNVNAHSSSAWEMITPYRREVNQYIFEEYVIKALDFTVSDFVDDNPSDYSVYGLDNPRYSITIDAYKSYTVLLGNDKDGESIYMQVVGLPNVYSISKELVKYRDYTPVYLLDSLVFSRIINFVDTIEFNSEFNYVMKIDGKKFYMNDKEVDEELFEEMYRSLISSVISGEVVDAVGSEICRYTFNYNTGTPSETVVFYEYGELYAAVEINGSTEFYIKRSFVDDMLNAVNKLAE